MVIEKTEFHERKREDSASEEQTATAVATENLEDDFTPAQAAQSEQDAEVEDTEETQ